MDSLGLFVYCLFSEEFPNTISNLQQRNIWEQWLHLLLLCLHVNYLVISPQLHRRFVLTLPASQFISVRLSSSHEMQAKWEEPQSHRTVIFNDQSSRNDLTVTSPSPLWWDLTMRPERAQNEVHTYTTGGRKGLGTRLCMCTYNILCSFLKISIIASGTGT